MKLLEGTIGDYIAQLTALKEIVEEGEEYDAYEYRRHFMELLESVGWVVEGNIAEITEDGITYTIKFDCDRYTYTLFIQELSSKKVKKFKFNMEVH